MNKIFFKKEFLFQSSLYLQLTLSSISPSLQELKLWLKLNLTSKKNLQQMMLIFIFLFLKMPKSLNSNVPLVKLFGTKDVKQLNGVSNNLLVKRNILCSAHLTYQQLHLQVEKNINYNQLQLILKSLIILLVVSKSDISRLTKKVVTMLSHGFVMLLRMVIIK